MILNGSFMTESDKFIPLSSPDIRQQDIDEVVRVLKTGMLVQGVEVERLESEVASLVGVRNCIAVSNGTASLHLCLTALGIGKGDEVIVPAFSYVATANVVELAGATPVFVDIDLSTYNIDATQIEKAITGKTKAIIPVHEFGLSCDIHKINEIAAAHNLFVIEDAACALGAKSGGQYVGSFGIAGSFSLHPRKAITAGEGGLITTNDDNLASRLRILRNHGIQFEAGKMEFVDAGFNYRLTNFQATLAASQLKRLENIIAYKNELANVYFDEIKNPLVTLPSRVGTATHTWQTFHLLLNDCLDQYKVIKTLNENGIGSNYGAQCIPYQKFYQHKYRLACENLFPNALKAFTKGLAIPMFEKMNKDDVKRVAQIINKISEL